MKEDLWAHGGHRIYLRYFGKDGLVDDLIGGGILELNGEDIKDEDDNDWLVIDYRHLLTHLTAAHLTAAIMTTCEASVMEPNTTSNSQCNFIYSGKH